MVTAKATILVVDDELPIRRLLRRCFEGEGYRVLDAADIEAAAAALAEEPVDLITLDLTLGGEDGLAFLRRVRAGSAVPVIIISGKGELIDKVVGLEVGADDYVPKPFELREVLARVRSVLRRSGTRAADPSAPPARTSPPEDRPAVAEPGRPAAPVVAAADTGAGEIYRFAGCTLDAPARELRDAHDEPIELTTSEFDLLHLFLRRPRHALSRDRIMDALRGTDWNPSDRSVDNHVAHLRHKLAASGIERAIKTVRGIGYQFALPVTPAPRHD